MDLFFKLPTMNFKGVQAFRPKHVKIIGQEKHVKTMGQEAC